MPIMRENFADLEFAAGVHRNTIGEAITLIEARFVKL